MRQIFGAVLACLAIVGVCACGEASPPPPEGNALVQNLSNGAHGIIGGSSGPADFGTTILDGTQGVRVSCNVQRSGSSFSVSGHIESPDVSLEVSSTDIAAAGAYMTFTIQGSTVSGALNSVDGNNNPAPTCMLTTSEAGSKYIVKPGSIYAGYDCSNTRASSALQTASHINGRFLFTGCDK
jgi:ABC-type phosphate transport system substrate-binding protein